MAIIYGKNTAVDYAAGNLASFGKSYSRMGAAPLDMYEVWYNYDKLVEYASFRGNDANGNPVYDGNTEVVDTSAVTSYVGQKVAYVDEENSKIYHYSIQLDGSLKEIGVAPLGDGKSITVTADGVVSLLGADTADSLTLPRMKEDKSGIEWVPVSAVVEGDGNDNTTYTFTALTKGEGDATETYGFVVKTYFNGTAVEGGEFTFSFDVYTKSEVDAAIKEVADLVGVPAEDDDSTDTLYERIAAEVLRATNAESALSDRIGVAKDGETAATGVYAYVDGVVNALVNGVDPDKIDSLNELIAWVEAHPDIVSGLDERLDAVEGILEGIGGEGEKATVKDYVDDALTAHGTEADGKYATKQEIADAGYAVAADVARDYATKATTIAGYGITDAYTKNEVDTKIGTPGVPEVKDSEGNVTTEAVAGTGVFANTYSKAELNVLLDEIEGGSSQSAASVARQLDEYKSSNNQRVSNIEAQVGKDVNGEEPATGLFLEIDEARKVADEAKSASTKNANDISALQGQLGTTNTNVSGLTERLAALEAEVGEVAESRIDGLEGVTGQHTKDIGANTAAITKINSESIPALEQAIVDEKAARESADKAINDKIGTVENGKTVVEMINAVAGTIDFTPYATNARVDEIYKVEGETKSGVLANALVDVAANKAAIELLNKDEKTEGSVKHTVATELAKIISDDDTDIDTLNEIAAWIVNDTTGAAKMANDIAALNTKVDTGDKKVSEYVAAEIAKIPTYDLPLATKEVRGGVKFDDETIKMDADERLYVAKVSTDNLVLGAKTLVLNGGDAEVKTEE